MINGGVDTQRLFPHDLPDCSLADKAAVVSGWLDANRSELGIGRENRIARLCRITRASAGSTVGPGESAYLELVQSLKDVQEYWLIVEVLGERLLNEPFREVLVRSFRDSALPKDSSSHTPGRDAQFELFIAAIAARASLSVERVSDDGADWIVSTKVEKWSIEAKRITSLNRLEDAVRKAASQVGSSEEVGGAMVIDISVAVNPTHEPVRRHVPADELRRIIGWRGKQFRAQELGRLSNWIGATRAGIGLLILHDHVIVPAGVLGETSVPWALQGIWDYHWLKDGRANPAHWKELQTTGFGALPNF